MTGPAQSTPKASFDHPVGAQRIMEALYPHGSKYHTPGWFHAWREADLFEHIPRVDGTGSQVIINFETDCKLGYHGDSGLWELDDAGYLPGPYVSYGSWSCENVLQKHRRVAILAG